MQVQTRVAKKLIYLFYIRHLLQYIPYKQVATQPKEHDGDYQQRMVEHKRNECILLERPMVEHSYHQHKTYHIANEKCNKGNDNPYNGILPFPLCQLRITVRAEYTQS